MTDVGPVAPPTYVPGDASKRELDPGYPVVLDGLNLPAPPVYANFSFNRPADGAGELAHAAGATR